MMSLSNTTQFGTNNETKPNFQNSPCSFDVSVAEKISKLSVHSLILLTSLLGNVFVITMVYKRKELRKTVNIFIVNMAVSDVLFSLSVFPVEITRIASDSWHWRVGGITGLVLCKFYSLTKQASFLISVQSMLWIAVDRFVAILFPMKIGLISRTIRVTAIASSWIIAVLFNSPLLVIWALARNGNKLFCTAVNTISVFPNQKALIAYFWLQLAINIIAPLILMSFLYTAIAIALRRRRKALTHFAANVQRHSLRKQKRAVQMCFVVMTAFYICVIPQALLYFVNNWTTSCVFLYSFSITADVLFYTSAAVNPIICLSFVESYRRGLKNVLTSCGGIRSKKVTLRGISY